MNTILAKLIYSLDHPQKKVVGLITSLPMEGAPQQVQMQMMQQGQQAPKPWVIIQQMQQLFEVRSLGTDFTTIDKNISVLMIVHPKDLSDQALYAIDQYVLAGGKAMVFVDPHAEADVPPQNPQNPYASMMAPKHSSLPTLFSSWGIEMKDGHIVGDMGSALKVNAGQGQGAVDFVIWLGLKDTNFNKDEVTTGSIGSMNMASAGFLNAKEGATTSMINLITTSDQSMEIPTSKIQFRPNPVELFNNFTSSGEIKTLAARITGDIESAFPDGPPKTEEAKTDATGHLAKSTSPINVIVVADTDLLTDRFWVRIQNFFGQQMASAFANNGDFVINSLDSLCGSNDLISVRSRGKFSRPFELVADLQREAESRFRTQEQELQKKLEETEKNLAQLQQSQGKTGAAILSSEQQLELQKFRDEKIKTRKQLREVRHQLQQDIEKLGTKLKMINIGLMPLLIVIFAVFMAYRRKKNENKMRAS